MTKVQMRYTPRMEYLINMWNLQLPKQARLLPSDPSNTLYQSECCPTVVQITNRSSVSLRNTFSNCPVLFRYVHSFVYASFNYHTATMRRHGCRMSHYKRPCNRPCWCQLDRNWSSDSNYRYNTAYSSASASSCMQTTVADGHKFSVVRHLSQPCPCSSVVNALRHHVQQSVTHLRSREFKGRSWYVPLHQRIISNNSYPCDNMVQRCPL